MQTENCKIVSTMLGPEDHGIMTFFVHLKGSGWGQGLGGFNIGGEGHNFGITAIRKILETVGVSKWEDLPGTLCRAKVECVVSWRPPIIGHIIEDRWFDLDAFSREWREKAGA